MVGHPQKQIAKLDFKASDDSRATAYLDLLEENETLRENSNQLYKATVHPLWEFRRQIATFVTILCLQMKRVWTVAIAKPILAKLGNNPKSIRYEI